MAPENIEILTDAQKLFKPNAKNQQKSFQLIFAILVISTMGEILWTPPVSNAIVADFFCTFLATTRAALNHIFEPEPIQRTIEMMTANFADLIFCELYVPFSDRRLHEQNFLKIVNPDYIDVFTRHVACLLNQINKLTDYQKKCMLIFTRRDWTPIEITHLLDPRIIITHHERLLVEIFIEGSISCISKRNCCFSCAIGFENEENLLSHVKNRHKNLWNAPLAASIEEDRHESIREQGRNEVRAELMPSLEDHRRQSEFCRANHSDLRQMPVLLQRP
jgi:hypothetical protein